MYIFLCMCVNVVLSFSSSKTVMLFENFSFNYYAYVFFMCVVYFSKL